MTHVTHTHTRNFVTSTQTRPRAYSEWRVQLLVHSHSWSVWKGLNSHDSDCLLPDSVTNSPAHTITTTTTSIVGEESKNHGPFSSAQRSWHEIFSTSFCDVCHKHMYRMLNEAEGELWSVCPLTSFMYGRSLPPALKCHRIKWSWNKEIL